MINSLIVVVQLKAAWRSDRTDRVDFVACPFQVQGEVQGAACACQFGAQFLCLDSTRLRDITACL
jgi:hypothetical protein